MQPLLTLMGFGMPACSGGSRAFSEGGVGGKSTPTPPSEKALKCSIIPVIKSPLK